MAEEKVAGERVALEALAALHGVEVRHRDGFDQEVRPDPETLLAVLQALGAPVEGMASVPAALEERRLELDERVMEPVNVVWRDGSGGAAARPPLRLGPGASPDEAVEVRVRTEDGRVLEAEERIRSGETSPWVPLPGDPGPGYHEVEVRAGARRAVGLLVGAPARAFGGPGDQEPGGQDRQRRWGLFLPLYALRKGPSGERLDRDSTLAHAGAGSLSGLEALLRWTGQQGGSAVGTLPLLAAYLDEPLEPSPYAPVSRLFWNELYLDPTRLPEWDHAPEARELAGSAGVQAELRALDETTMVKYRPLAKIRHRLLDFLARAWRERDGESGPELQALLEERPEALRYAEFRGAVARRGLPSSEWPEAWRRSGIAEEEVDDAVRLRHLYAQLRFREQLREVREEGSRAGAGLYLDLPLGAHPEGFDAWQEPGLFAAGASMGAPPDGFQPEGQSWGLPPLRPEASREQGHQHFRDVLRTLMTHADRLRIDHVMGLHRLYWVPPGMGAHDGAYVRYPAEELYAVLSLESHRHRTAVVGEDLGTVPPEVRETMDAVGLRRSYVVPFETRPDEEEGLAPVPDGAVATLNTHDLPPFAAFWRGLEEEPRKALSRAAGVEPAPGRHEDPWPVLAGLLERLVRSPAGLVLVSLEDLWLEERPQNRPGTLHPENWRGRSRLTLDEIREDPRVGEALAALGRGREP